jgi:aminobenzoyl-glutamate utilization protein B
MMDERMKNIIASHEKEFEAVSDKIWDFAEYRFVEFKSAELQAKFLEERGFTVTRRLGGMETAFKAEWGENGPVIGFLGEFDALPGLSQKADCAEETPVEKGACGHGCGHHLLGTGCMEAACALAEYLRETGRPGRIVYFGCPAEESGAGKAFMAREHCFDGVDFCLAWHPNTYNGLMARSLANARVIFKFTGKAAHAAAMPEKGRSALDSCEIMSVGVNYLREHVPTDVRMHYAYLDVGGTAPNVVQPHAAVLYALRAPESDQVQEVYERVCDVAKGAALICGTSVEEQVVSAYASTLLPAALRDLAYACVKESAAEVSYTPEEIEYAKKFVAAGSQPDAKEPIVTGVEDPAAAKMGGSTDVGDVSWLVPTVGVYTTTYAAGTVMHGWTAVAQGRSSIAKKGMHTAARAMSRIALALLDDEKLRQRVRADFETAKAGRVYKTLIPDSMKPGMF